jgi:hypothetical protein
LDRLDAPDILILRPNSETVSPNPVEIKAHRQ